MFTWIRRQTVRERCVILIQCIYLLLYLSIKHNHSLIEVCTDSYHRLFQHFAFYHVYIEDIVFHLTFAHVHLNTQDPDAKTVSILFSYKESIKTHQFVLMSTQWTFLFYFIFIWCFQLFATPHVKITESVKSRTYATVNMASRVLAVKSKKLFQCKGIHKRVCYPSIRKIFVSQVRSTYF